MTFVILCDYLVYCLCYSTLVLLCYCHVYVLYMLVATHLVMQGPVKSGFLTPPDQDRGPQPDLTAQILQNRTGGSVTAKPDLTPVQLPVQTGQRPIAGLNRSTTGQGRLYHA